MKKQRNRIAVGKTKGFLIMLMSVVVAVAIGVTCALVSVGAPSKRMPADVGTDGEAHQSASYTNPTSGRNYNSSSYRLYNGDQLIYNNTTAMYSVTLPAGIYKIEAHGGAGGKNGNGEAGGNGGYAKTGLTLKSALSLYMYIGSKGGDANGNTGGAGGKTAGTVKGGKGGNGTSNNGGGGGGGRTYIALTSGCTNGDSSCVAHLLIEAGGGGGRGGKGNGGSPNSPAQYSGGTGGNGSGNANAGSGGTSTSGNGTSGGGGGGGTTSAAGAAGLAQCPDKTSSKDGTYSPAGGGGGGAGYYSGGGGAGGSRYGNGSRTLGKNGTAGGTLGVGGNGGNGAARTTGYYSGVGGGGGGGSGYIKSGALSQNSNAVCGAVTVKNSYVNETVSPTSGAQNASDGYVVITALEVNRDPSTKSTPYSLGEKTRGTYSNASLSFGASDIANDLNVVGSESGQTIDFSNGNTSNLDTVSTAVNGVPIYLNTSKTSASDYITWKYNSTTHEIEITEIRRIPRKNYSTGCTEDNKLNLYVYVRDNYGDSSTYNKRGYALIHFTLTVKETSAAYHSNVSSSDNQNINAKQTANTVNKVRVGKSAGNNLSSATGPDTQYIYNPNGPNRYTAFVTGDMKVYNSSVYTTAAAVDGISVQLTAASLITNYKSAYDIALISLNSTTGITSSNSSRQYKIRELDNESGYTSYRVTTARKNDASGTYIPNAFTQITIVGMKSGSNYIVLPVTLYLVERTGARGTNYQSTYFTPVQMDIVFKVTNARPVMRNMNNVPVVSTKALSTATVGFTNSNTINLNSYFIDSDVSTMTSSTHKIMEVKLPTSEYVQVTKEGKVVSVSSPSNGMYYNAIKNAAYPSSAAFTAASSSGMLGSGYETGFPTDIVTTGAVNSDKAFVQYSYTQSALSVYGLRASRSMYASGRYGGKAIVAENNANNGYARNAGHFYLLVRINDLGDSDDTGIWLPIAVQVNNSAPTPTKTERGSAGASIMPTAEGTVGQEFVFSPMGVTVNGTTYAIGKYKKSNGTYTSDGLQALASDADNFYSASMTANGYLNELLKVTDSNSALQGAVSNNSAQRFYTVTTEPIYIPVSYFDGRVTAGGANASSDIVSIDGVDHKKINGVKIKLNSWTFNRYLYQSVTVTDQEGIGTGSGSPVNIAVKVANTAPTAAAAASVAKIDYTYNGTHILTNYTEAETPVIRYDIPVDSTVFITPYDILTDYDMTQGGVTYPEKGFTLNGLSGVYNRTNYRFTVGSTSAAAGELSVKGIADSKNAYCDYSSDDYKNLLLNTLGSTKLNASHTYSSCFADNNRFGSASSKDMGVDRLYFKRTDDAQHLDGYKFDPYVNQSINQFAVPNVSNGTYLDLNFGSKIKINGTDYKLDFLAITGKSRMQVGMKSEFELEIRDRTGAGAAGASYGVKKIKVEVRVVNSTPYLSDPTAIKTVSTTPIVRGVGGATVDVPTTLSIAVKKETTVNGVRVFADDSFLKDNEDLDISFMPEKGVRVLNGDNEKDGIPYVENGITVSAGKSYLGNYLDVDITTDTLTVTALNSTQSVNTLWLVFYATDGRSADEFSELKIRVEVLNSKMLVNYGDDGFVKGESGAILGMNLWVVDAVNATDEESDRFFAPNTLSAAKFAAEKNISSAKIKALTTDADPLQGAVLSRVAGSTIPTGSSSKLKDYVPNLDAGGSVSLTWRNGNSAPAVGPAHEHVDLGRCDIWFFDGTTWKTRDQVVAELGETTYADVSSAVASKYFDAKGRWKIVDWVISVKPKKAFPSGQYLQLTVLMRDQAVYGGDSFGLDTSFKSGSASDVDGYVAYTYQMTIKSPGIVTYNYYDQFGGYYTVADGVDSNINYISTVNSTAKGANSGAVYTNGQEYVYDTGETAFKYSHTIKVDGDSTKKTYIPMSYMALRKGLVRADAEGNVAYETAEYVAYDVGSGAGYNRYELSNISTAITISDGENSWSGNDETTGIAANPYVNILSYENNVSGGEEDFSNSLESPYFNKNLAVANKKSVDGTVQDIYTNADAGNKFADGKALYLAAQRTSLQEHQFGISLSKKTTRASSSGLTISVNVALCQKSGTSTKINYGSGTTEEERQEDKAKKTATVVFNLDIGNSKISLTPDASNTAANAIQGDATAGYYTSVELYNGGTPFSYTLARETSATDYNKTVVYADSDTSDQAYFYYDSSKKLDSWSSGESAYKRANAFASSKYTNTSDNSIAQASMHKYFAEHNGNVAANFIPNGGMYGTDDEGFSNYFGIAVTDGGTRISISPLAKTVLADSVAEADYAARGLVVSETKKGKVTKAYYPLRVLIYDSCGDGWNSASYVSLEIRVCVLNAAPTLRQNLAEAVELKDEDRITSLVKTQLSGATEGDKAVEISVGVGEEYALNVSELISDSDLLVSGKGNSYWTVPEHTSQFKLETGDIFGTPFANGISADADASNTALRKGTMKFFDNKTKSLKSEQPDVMMTMDCDGTAISDASVPKDNYIRVTVNRRTTYKVGNDVISQNQFLISLDFADSSGAKTKKLYIIVTIANNLPTVRMSDVTSNVTMRVGDHFTLLATPYDYFNGTHKDVGAKLSADNSYTYSNYVASRETFVEDANEYLTGNNNYPSYDMLTAAKLAQPKYKLRSSTTNEPANANLGYAGIAKDDTPWTLRITNVSLVRDSDKFSCDLRDKVPMESERTEFGYLSANIIALGVCSNVQLVVTLSDGEANSAISYTMYISVASSKPSPITSVEDGKTQTLNTGLTLHYDPADNRNSSYEYRKDSEGEVIVTAGTVEALGVYDLYMIASGDASASSSKSRSVQIYDGVKTKTVTAYESLQIDIEKVAFDLDSEDDLNIGLFRTGRRFSLNGFGMEPEGNSDTIYKNDKYRIEILDAYERSFRITCLSFDAYNDCDELSFYVRDNGNDIMDNTVKIVIRICTLYSAVTNKHAIQNAQPDGSNFYTSYAETVNVKSYDDYVGNSVDIDERDPEGPNGERNIVGNPSTYQFLSYKGKADSVDQTADGFIVDPDVASSTTNLNYDVKVYAFVNLRNGVAECMKPADVTKKYIDVGAERGNPTNYFKISDAYRSSDPGDANRQEIDGYLVGGKHVDGTSYDAALNRDLLEFINKYFMFSIGADGVSLTFTPVTANLSTKILFYVEVEKDVDHSRKIYPTNKTAISCGSLFYVEVENSAPIANDDVDTASARSFTGKVGEYAFFSVFDRNDRISSMFSDSDVEDTVKIKGHESGTNTADYNDAFSAVPSTLDWRSGGGKARAVDIVANNGDTPKNYRKNNTNISIPAHSLLVYINRRIDVKDSQNKYQEAVSFDIKFVGEDSKKKTATSALHITIVNSDITVKESAIMSKLDNNGVGYTLSHGDDEYSYVLDTFVTKDSPALELSVFSWLYDPDNPNNNVITDEDSYRLVKNDDAHRADYITDGEFEVSTMIGTTKTRLARITPTFKDGDKNHFMSITVTPDSYLRGHTGTAYMQILDRSGSGLADNDSHGVFITVNVTILNSAPVLLRPGEVKEYSLIGSTTETLQDTVIDIADFVSDPNDTDKPSQAGMTDTYLRIVGVNIMLPESMTSTAVDSVQNSLVTVSYDSNDPYNVKLLIRPQTGFFGSQSVQITVADGDIGAKDVTFTVKFKVSYNFAEIGNLNDVTALRGMTTTLTPQLLVSEIDNTYVASSKGAPRTVSSSDNGISVSADGDGTEELPTFNPGADYVVTKVTVPTSYTDYVRIIDNDGIWQFRAMRLTQQSDIELSAEFTLASDVGKENAVAFPGKFKVHIDENPKPELIDAFKNGYTFYQSGDGYLLNEDGVVNLTPDKLFTDNPGDIMKFISASSKIPSLVDVKVTAEDNLEIRFLANGRAEITVEVADTTDESKSFTFTVINIDMPDPTFWQSVVISFESHTWIWIGVIGAIVLLIAILIIVIIALKRRKRKREELEAILMSEMELEEQMMRLAAPGATAYQSYGYLPPTMNAQQDPNLMLGTGAGFDPTTTAIGLNPGTDAAQSTAQQSQSGPVNYGGGNNGVPPESGM